MSQKAAFFDRDGTLIDDVGYLKDVQSIKFIEEHLNFVRLCQNFGFDIFVITNQSGVARGFFDESFVDKTHQLLKNLLLQRDIEIKDFYFCPHHPSQATVPAYQQDCECRKPKPGMLLRAAQEHSLDLSKSFMFGDCSRDLEAGDAAGCKSFNIGAVASLPYYQLVSLFF